MRTSALDRAPLVRVAAADDAGVRRVGRDVAPSVAPCRLSRCETKFAASGNPATERRWNRTIQAGGCPALPVLKTDCGYSPACVYVRVPGPTVPSRLLAGHRLPS